jgi:predicted aldo/keto reductase-like oxidoreductase
MPCPFGVNIPNCFQLYNQYYMVPGRLMTRIWYGVQLMGGMGVPAYAGLCRNCGKCMKACPQHIAVPDELRKVSKKFDGLRTKALMPLVRLVFSDKIKDE